MSLHKKVSKYTQEEINDAYISVFTGPKGNIVLEHLSLLCHIDETTYVFGNVEETIRREGERRVVLEILKRVDTDIIDFVNVNKTEEENDNVFTD